MRIKAIFGASRRAVRADTAFTGISGLWRIAEEGGDGAVFGAVYRTEAM